MIRAVTPGLALAALICCWLGATASAGEHVRPGRLARIAARAWSRRMGWPVPYPEDADEDLAGEATDRERQDLGIGRGEPPGDDSAIARQIRMHWADEAILRATAPHLFSDTWLDEQLADHWQWAVDVWEQICTMKREAGI